MRTRTWNTQGYYCQDREDGENCERTCFYHLAVALVSTSVVVTPFPVWVRGLVFWTRKRSFRNCSKHLESAGLWRLCKRRRRMGRAYRAIKCLPRPCVGLSEMARELFTIRFVDQMNQKKEAEQTSSSLVFTAR